MANQEKTFNAIKNAVRGIHKPVAIILSGPPACGKTTFVQDYLEGFVVVSSDDYIQSYADRNNSTYSKVFKECAKEANKHCLRVFHEAIKNGENIVIDRTNTSVKSRRKWMPHLNDYHKVLVIFDIDKDVVLQRAEFRGIEEGKSIPRHVIESMFENMAEAADEEKIQASYIIK